MRKVTVSRMRERYAQTVLTFRITYVLLSKVMKAAKKLHYDKMTLNSTNKMETTWKIIKTEKGKTNQKLGVQSLKINNTER